MAAEPKTGKSESSHMPHLIQAGGAVLAALVTIGPGLYGVIKGDGPAKPYVVLIDAVTGKAKAAEPAETATLAALPAAAVQPAPQPALPPPPPPAAASPLTAEGAPMQRMASDPRLSMRVMSVALNPTARQIMSLRIALTSQGQSKPFVDYQTIRDNWSVDADKAGHCWQQRQSGLPEFSASDLPVRSATLASLGDGQTLSIRADYQCDNPILPGDTITVTSTPVLADVPGQALGLPIRFQSAPILLP